MSEAPSTTSDLSIPRRPLIVAIDDDPDMLALIRVTLKSTYDIATYADPKVGVAAILERKPSLVLTDMTMPGMSGLEVIEAIRGRFGATDLPLVVLSARGQEEVILQCFALGATDYLVKPVSPGALKAKVTILLRRASPPTAPGTAASTEVQGASGTPAADRDFPLGRRFAGYKLARKIGQGGMGIVFDATGPDGRRVALKVLAPHLASDKVLLARFFREAENLKAVQHPNIAAFYELGHENLNYYLAMEYVDGPPLDAYFIQHCPYPDAKVRDALLQIARALDALSNVGIVHRDVKPSNVLVAPDGTLKLADFGLTKRATDQKLTATNVLMGTAAYLAPELITRRETADADARSDLYALGVIGYYLATGVRPFEGDNNFSLVFQHVTDAPRDPRELAPALSLETTRVILKLLEKRPSDRYQTPGELIAELEGGKSG